MNFDEKKIKDKDSPHNKNYIDTYQQQNNNNYSKTEFVLKKKLRISFGHAL